MIKIAYGIKVIQKRFKLYTNTYAVLTNLVNLLVVFLNLSMAIYLAYVEQVWVTFIFIFCLLIVNIYFIGVTKELNRKVSAERKAALAAESEEKGTPLMNGAGDDSDTPEEDEAEGEEDTEQEVRAR